MEIKLRDRVFQIPDSCPKQAPRKATLKRNLREHGPEAFLTSRKLQPMASCVLEELVNAGAEVVEAQPAESPDRAAASRSAVQDPS